jgi:hypothetical protein
VGGAGISAVLGIVLFAFVDLTPEVQGDFFFSTDDPALRQSLAIEKEFGTRAVSTLPDRTIAVGGS